MRRYAIQWKRLPAVAYLAALVQITVLRGANRAEVLSAGRSAMQLKPFKTLWAR